MSDKQLILNAYLFIYLRKEKNVKLKKVSVLRCLKRGADVNTVDGNQRNNTPLHVAVSKDEIEIVQLLLDKGALTNVSNLDQKTPLDIARDLQTESGKQIFQLLSQPVLETPSERELVSPKTVLSKPTAKPLKQCFYVKRGGTAGVCGQLYETKLLCLVLLRALNDKHIKDFLLGTNIAGIGALDDLCLRLKVQDYNKPIMIYLQAKHREDCDKGRLTVENIRNDTGDFSLNKYFDSYLRIKDKFKPNNSDDMFNGEFTNTETNIIIYTPTKNLFTRKLIGKHKLSVKVHEIINTSEKGEVFQFDYEESDLESLTNMIIQDRVKSLGSIFLHFIMAEKDKSEVMMSNEYITSYHYVLSREVIFVSEINEIQVKKETKQIRFGSFRSDFFTCSSKYLVCLRETFYKEISSTHCDKTPIEDNTVVNLFQDILLNPNEIHISRVIGKLATYNEETLKLEIIETTNIKNQSNKNVSAQKTICDGLLKLEIQPNVIREAVWLKLRGMTFNLPPHFGNLDMYFRGSDQKVKSRIKDVVEKLLPLFTNYQASKIVEIDDETVGHGQPIKRGLLEINGGIGSAVGNLLVLDEETKMYKMDLDKTLPKHAKVFLSQFLHFIDKEELRKYRLKINIAGFTKYHFDGDEFDKRQAIKFLNNLWFYTNQAQEDEVEKILKKEITKHYNNESEDKEYFFRLHSDAIYLQSHDEVQKWWMKPGKAPYLNSTTQYFKKAKDAVIDTPLLTVLNFMIIKKLQTFKINFNQVAVCSLHLPQMIGRLYVKTEECIFTALKISQYFHSASNYTFIDFDYILEFSPNEYNSLIRDLRKTKKQYLIIIYEGFKKRFERFCETLKQVMDAFIGENVIVVSKFALADEIRVFEGDNYVSVFDSYNNFIDLSEDSQMKILEYRKVYFQGEDIRLKFLLNKVSKRLVKTKILKKILFSKCKIKIGKALIQNFHISMTNDKDTIIYHGERRIQVDNLYDIEDEVVIIHSSTLKMNNSMLLTYLSLNTKRMSSLPWIIRINSDDCKNVFKSLLRYTVSRNRNNNEPKLFSPFWTAVKVVKFLSKVALQRDFDNIVTFEEDGSYFRIKNSEVIADPMVLFELEYFLELFNSNKVIFIFEHIDLKCGYTNEIVIMNIIKVLKDKGKRMWITTCPMCYRFRALKLEFESIMNKKCYKIKCLLSKHDKVYDPNRPQCKDPYVLKK